MKRVELSDAFDSSSNRPRYSEGVVKFIGLIGLIVFMSLMLLGLSAGQNR